MRSLSNGTNHGEDIMSNLVNSLDYFDSFPLVLCYMTSTLEFESINSQVLCELAA